MPDNPQGLQNPFAEVTYRCAVCGIRRGEANHWLIAMVNQTTVILSLWDHALATAHNAHPLCGEKCAHALQSRFISDLRKANPQLRLNL